MRAWIGLGSNLGDRLALLRAARRALDADASTRVTAASRVYETEPVGPGAQGRYLNAVVAVDTEREPRALLDLLLATELALGRDRGADAVRFGPRLIDLDLLLFEQRCVEAEGLVIPHPRLHERAFVLLPLAEIAGDVVHASLGRPIAELAAGAPGREGVTPCPEVDAEDWSAPGGVDRGGQGRAR